MEFVTEQSVYIPTFWRNHISAVSHDQHTIDCANVDMSNPENLEFLASRIQQTFAKVGLVHVTNTRISGPNAIEDMRAIASSVISCPMVSPKLQ